MRHIRMFGHASLIAVAISVTACGGSTPVTPPAVNNTPPSIESVSIAANRAEADQPVQVTASVKDAETPVGELTYTWSASPDNGTFIGIGATVTWRPPKGQTTPDLYTITLTVTERFTSGGQPRVNTVSSSTTVRYNDSPAEAIAIAKQFIRDFGTFDVSPEQCVRNFSNTGSCAEEGLQELEQIENNREDFHILSSSFPAPVATFNSSLTEGTVEGRCTFEDIPGPGQENAGHRQFVSGTCALTTVYENFRWYLCGSTFEPPYITTLASLQGRVPGRIRFK